MSKPTRTENRREDNRQEALSCGTWSVEGGRAGAGVGAAATCPGERYGSLGSLSAGTPSGPEDGAIR